MNLGRLRRRHLLATTLLALHLPLAGGPVAAQRVTPGPFAGFEARKQAHASAFLPLFQEAADPGEAKPRKPFLLTLLAGTAAGAGAGFLLGSMIQDWTGPGGAAVGLVSGTLMGVVVGVGKFNGLKGFLAGVVPGYCIWLAAGAPADFVLDPLFLLGIPGAVAGAVSASPGR